MVKYTFIFFIIFFSLKVYSNDNLLTIQQQLERLQREVSDLSQIVFSGNENTGTETNNNLVTNLSAIDMRIYDIEKDVKNLTANFEDIQFQLEDLNTKITNFEEIIISLENKILNLINNKTSDLEVSELNEENQENTLGSLKITSENEIVENKTMETLETNAEEINLSPEDMFQLAFDNIRKKNWEEAKKSLNDFIIKNPENQLSGSAHYWLGELHMLEKKYRDAALVFAEGFQKFPTSIKAPDMLYKLSQSLYEVDKINESCKTLEKLILDYPKNKFIKNANKQIQNYGCLQSIE